MNYFGGGGGGSPPRNGGGGGGGLGSNGNIKPDPPDQKLSPDEESSLRSILSEGSEDILALEEEAHHKLWVSFQAAAASLTQLYRNGEQIQRQQYQGRGPNSSSTAAPENQQWVHFQTAAGNLTTLYSGSVNGLLRPSTAACKKSGYIRARKELASWARSRRRFIRREELLAVIASMSCQNDQQTNTPAMIRTSSSAASPATAATAASRIEPLIGVEELLQAATVQDTAADQAATVAAVAGAGGVLAPAFRPLKRSFPSSTVVSRTPSPKSHSDSDVNMTDIPGPPTIKRPRQS